MYDKKKLIILRAVLIAVGLAVGGTAMWQYFAYYPDAMRRELQIVVIVVTSVLFGGILGLSAKPFYRLGASIGTQFQKIVKDLGLKGVTATLCGIAAAVAFGLLFDFLMSLIIDILAVRVLLDVLVVALVAALCCYGFVRWITVDGSDAPTKRETPYGGYLLTASCFYDDRVYVAADFLTGVKVTQNVFKALWKYGDGAALERLKILSESGALDILRCGTQFDDVDGYSAAEADAAASRRLKPLKASNVVFPDMDGACDIAVFAEPDGALKDKYIKLSIGGAADAPQTFVGSAPDTDDGHAAAPVSGDDGTPNGQIIIDK